MADLLAWLDGPPFPGTEETIVSGMLAQPSVAHTSVASQAPGPSGQNSNPPDLPVSNDMLAVLCEQVALLADTQVMEGEKAEREHIAAMDAMRASMTQMSRSITTLSQGARPATDMPQA